MKYLTVSAVRSALHSAAPRGGNFHPEDALRAVGPLLEHATNNEPWYQSRVTWGAIAAIVVPVLGAVGVGTDIISAEELTVWGMAVGSAAGGVLTLYGRWKAKRPIGG